jgi:Uma2 family endonuclease
MSTVTLEKTKKLYIYEDYAKLSEVSSYQLIGGELIITPSPVPYHQIILRRIGFELVKFVEDRKCGEVLYAPMDVYLSDTETYQPDIIFISNERLNIIGEKKIEAAPDLVIEILSESTAYYDLKQKRRSMKRQG